jgi:glycine/D-amino acid oxidase-like deaminating enzyme
MELDQENHTVIIGGGVIGSCAAYFLTRHPKYDPKKHRITLLEASRLAGGASGKAGGCLASWASPRCLAQLSFQLHSELAAEHNGEKNWGYRRTRCIDCETNVESSQQRSGQASSNLSKGQNPEPDWIFPDRIQSCVEIGNLEDTAQLHPYLFTTFLIDKAKSSGVDVVMASATAINYSKDNKAVRSVSYRTQGSEDAELKADQVVLAAGCWTPGLLPAAPIGGDRSHSIVLRVPSREISPHILFVEEPDQQSWFPQYLEVYPRPDDTVYICGLTDEREPLPPSTDAVAVDAEGCRLLRRAAESLSGRFVGAEVLAQQACYKPAVRVAGRDPDTGPLLGGTGVEGLILAAGHDQWGIQNSAATGKIVSELVLDGKAISADISSLDPRKVL